MREKIIVCFLIVAFSTFLGLANRTSNVSSHPCYDTYNEKLKLNVTEAHYAELDTIGDENDIWMFLSVDKSTCSTYTSLRIIISDPSSRTFSVWIDVWTCRSCYILWIAAFQTAEETGWYQIEAYGVYSDHTGYHYAYAYHMFDPPGGSKIGADPTWAAEFYD